MKQICCGKSICCDGLPFILPTNNKNKNKKPWMVTENLDEDGVVNVHTIEDGQPSNYAHRIPGLQHLGGICIHGLSRGWMILTTYPDSLMWSLWNPLTSKLIRLPPLPFDADSNSFLGGCLTSPPGHPNSILLLSRARKPDFVFCRLVSGQRKKPRIIWDKISYAEQLKRLMGGGEVDVRRLQLFSLTCCNGKVYALSHGMHAVVQIHIKVVEDKQVVISISPFLKYPHPYSHIDAEFYELKGYGTDLFAITGRIHAPAGFYLFKTTTHDDDDDDDYDKPWEEINDLKDAVFFVDECNIVPVSYIPAVASGLGGYVHVRDSDRRTFVNSFHVKDKTLLQLPMPCLVKAFQVSMWEYSRGLEAGNDRQVKCKNDDKQQEDKENDDPIVVLSNTEEDGESRLLDVPFHVLEMIVEHCVGIEYMNMRATCKRCHLAAPPIHWRNKTALTKLQKYSLSSPWLMVVEAHKGIMNFTDPISGDKYFMKLILPAPLSLNYDEHNSKSCSKYGWLLFYAHSSNLGDHQLVFFNPFTNDVRNLPPTPPHYLENLCFSAPPTSDDCVVVGFSTEEHAAFILRYHVDQQLLWRRFDVDYGGGGPAPYAFHFPTFHGRDLYALCNERQLVVFKDMSEGSFNQPEVVAAEPPECPDLYQPQYFLMERGQYLLLVIVDNFGGDPQLFQFNDSTEEWNQIQSLDKHVVFIGDATCVCFEAKTTLEMQNKIYFPRLKDGNLIFYSLETSKYHTFDGKLATREESFGCGCRSFLTHLSLHAWIEPTWY